MFVFGIPLGLGRFVETHRRFLNKTLIYFVSSVNILVFLVTNLYGVWLQSKPLFQKQKLEEQFLV